MRGLIIYIAFRTFCYLQPCTHSHTHSGVNHSGRQSARQEQSGSHSARRSRGSNSKPFGYQSNHSVSGRAEPGGQLVILLSQAEDEALVFNGCSVQRGYLNDLFKLIQTQ